MRSFAVCGAQDDGVGQTGTPLATYLFMRIQQTDRILKDARAARHSHEQHEHEHNANILSRAWRAIVGAIKR